MLLYCAQSAETMHPVAFLLTPGSGHEPKDESLFWSSHFVCSSEHLLCFQHLFSLFNKMHTLKTAKNIHQSNFNPLSTSHSPQNLVFYI